MKISGEVVRGKNKGKELGFPTVNIRLKERTKSGVYAGMVKVGGTNYRAGIFINKDSNLLEAHLIGFKGDLYGQEIEIEIGEKIRDVMEFESEEELKTQIKKDLKQVCLQE